METLEKIKYEKFNLIKNFEQDFEQTKHKNECLVQDIIRLE